MNDDRPFEQAYEVIAYPGEALDRPPQPVRPYTYEGLRETWSDEASRSRVVALRWTLDEAMADVQSAAVGLSPGVPLVILHPCVYRGPLGEPMWSAFNLMMGGSPIEWEGVTVGNDRVAVAPLPEGKPRAWLAGWHGFAGDSLWMLNASSGVDAAVRARAVRACLHRTAAWLREHLSDADRARLEALDGCVAEGAVFVPDAVDHLPDSLAAAIELYARASLTSPTAEYGDVLKALIGTARVTGGNGCRVHDHDLVSVLRREIPLGAAMLARVP